MLTMNECCKCNSQKGVMFEENLSSHKTRNEHLDFVQKLEKLHNRCVMNQDSLSVNKWHIDTLVGKLKERETSTLELR